MIPLALISALVAIASAQTTAPPTSLPQTAAATRGAATSTAAAVPVAGSCPSTDFFLNQDGMHAINYTTKLSWYKNKRLFFWDFGAYSAPAGTSADPASNIGTIPIWLIFYPNGTKAGNNIIDTLPCQPGYSDLWAAQNVTVKDATVPLNFYKDAATIKADAAAGKVTITDLQTLVNCPVVPFGSTCVDDSPNPTPMPPKPTTGWIKGQPVFYFDFGVIANGSAEAIQQGTVTEDVWHIYTASGASEGNGIFDVLGTPFWDLKNVTVPDNLAGSNEVKSAAAIVSGGYAVAETGKVVNCPVAYLESNGSAPMTSATAAATTTKSGAPASKAVSVLMILVALAAVAFCA